MREIEIHEYARQLLEAHGAQAIAEACVYRKPYPDFSRNRIG